MARIQGNPASGSHAGVPFSDLGPPEPGTGQGLPVLPVIAAASIWGQRAETRTWRGGTPVSSSPDASATVQDQGGSSITDQAGDPLS